MTGASHAFLNRLLEQNSSEDVRDTVLEIKMRLSAFDMETDENRKSECAEEIGDLCSVLEYELCASGMYGEDFVNDGVFHACNAVSFWPVDERGNRYTDSLSLCSLCPLC